MPLPDIVRTDLEQHLAALEAALETATQTADQAVARHHEATQAAADAVERQETLLDRVNAYKAALATDEQARVEAIDPALMASGVRVMAGPVIRTDPAIPANAARRHLPPYRPGEYAPPDALVEALGGRHAAPSVVHPLEIRQLGIGVTSAIHTLEVRLRSLRTHAARRLYGDETTRRDIREHEVALAALQGIPAVISR